MPVRIRIIGRDLARDAHRTGPEVPFKDDTMVIDHEAHDSRIAIGCRERDERVSTGHVAIDDIALDAPRRSWALGREYAEVIAVVGLRCGMFRHRFAGPVATGLSLRD